MGEEREGTEEREVRKGREGEEEEEKGEMGRPVEEEAEMGVKRNKGSTRRETQNTTTQAERGEDEAMEERDGRSKGLCE